MEKIYFIIICLLGFFCFLDNIFSGLLIPPNEAILVLLAGQLEVNQDSLLGTVFESFIRFVFALDLNDPSTYFRIFGV